MMNSLVRRNTGRMALILMIPAFTFNTVACAKRDNIGTSTLVVDPFEAEPTQYRPAFGQGVHGYNDPFEEDYRGDIGLRAVTWDRWLAVSIRNRGSDSIFLEPEAFRLLMPDRSLYPIGQERHRMTLFAPTELGPDQNTLLVARIPELDNLHQLQLVLNYPPRDAILRVRIEPTPEPNVTETPPTP